jgi:hypothetical protein
MRVAELAEMCELMALARLVRVPRLARLVRVPRVWQSLMLAEAERAHRCAAPLAVAAAPLPAVLVLPLALLACWPWRC